MVPPWPGSIYLIIYNMNETHLCPNPQESDPKIGTLTPNNPDDGSPYLSQTNIMAFTREWPHPA